MDERFREKSYPFASHLGMELVDWSEGYARIEMALQPFHDNRHGSPHGGIHAALLDTAMGYAGCWTGDPDKRQLCLTLSLNTQYISRPRGRMFIAEGFKTGGGLMTFFADGTLLDETGEVLAKGSGVFRYRRGRV
ncbi:MAG: PaaI family thioesterase [Roseivivax sp.]|nr:PaaI family thioesterase [Roseivivax sp.]